MFVLGMNMGKIFTLNHYVYLLPHTHSTSFWSQNRNHQAGANIAQGNNPCRKLHVYLWLHYLCFRKLYLIMY